MAFQVIEGGGKPEPDAALIEAAREFLADVESGRVRQFVIVSDTDDEEPEITCMGDGLLLGVLCEELGRALKREAIGL